MFTVYKLAKGWDTSRFCPAINSTRFFIFELLSSIRTFCPAINLTRFLFFQLLSGIKTFLPSNQFDEISFFELLSSIRTFCPAINLTRFLFFQLLSGIKTFLPSNQFDEISFFELLSLMPNPSASSKKKMNMLKIFWSCSIFLNVGKYFWPWSNMQNDKVKYNFWPC